MLPIDPNARIHYVCEADRDRPVEQRSGFTIRPLTYREQQHLASKYGRFLMDKTGRMEMESRHVEREGEVLCMALLGWSNFPPGAPENQGFHFTLNDGVRVLAPSTLDMLPKLARREIAHAIESFNGIDPVVAGKSAPPSES